MKILLNFPVKIIRQKYKNSQKQDTNAGVMRLDSQIGTLEVNFQIFHFEQ